MASTRLSVDGAVRRHLEAFQGADQRVVAGFVDEASHINLADTAALSLHPNTRSTLLIRGECYLSLPLERNGLTYNNTRCTSKAAVVSQLGPESMACMSILERILGEDVGFSDARIKTSDIAKRRHLTKDFDQGIPNGFSSS